MKQYIKLNLGDRPFGVCEYDTEHISPAQALAVIKEQRKAFPDLSGRDAIEDFASALGQNWVTLIDSEICLELDGLDSDGYEVEIHNVQFESGFSTPQPQVFVIGSDGFKYTGESFRTLGSREELDALRSKDNDTFFHIVE